MRAQLHNQLVVIDGDGVIAFYQEWRGWSIFVPVHIMLKTLTVDVSFTSTHDVLMIDVSTVH